MIVWYKTVSGIVTIAGRGHTLPVGAIAAPREVTVDKLVTMMVGTGGALVARPLSPDVTSLGTIHTVADCPAGTVIAVSDLLGQEIMIEITTTTAGQTEAFTLPDPGEYLIDVAAPLPALPRQKRIQQ